MNATILDLMLKHGEDWQRNEQRKEQAIKKKNFKGKLYPTHEDIYGESEVKNSE